MLVRAGSPGPPPDSDPPLGGFPDDSQAALHHRPPVRESPADVEIRPSPDRLHAVRGADVVTGVYLVRLHHPGGMEARQLLYLK